MKCTSHGYNFSVRYPAMGYMTWRLSLTKYWILASLSYLYHFIKRVVGLSNLKVPPLSPCQILAKSNQSTIAISGNISLIRPLFIHYNYTWNYMYNAVSSPFSETLWWCLHKAHYFRRQSNVFYRTHIQGEIANLGPKSSAWSCSSLCYYSVWACYYAAGSTCWRSDNSKVDQLALISIASPPCTECTTRPLSNRLPSSSNVKWSPLYSI